MGMLWLMLASPCMQGTRSNGRNRCSSYWKQLSAIANASGEAHAREQLCKKYFVHPSQLWNNSVDERYPKSPDFWHTMSRTTLWVDGWSSPLMAKALLKLVTRGKLQPHVGYHTQGSEDTKKNRLSKNNYGKKNSRLTSTGELRRIGQVDDVRVHLRSSSTSEAVSVLKNYVQQGIAVESYVYVEILQRCFKQKDLVLAKQVHDCSRKSGMEQNVYVANNLLRVYIRCGKLEDARQVFNNLMKKSVFSWTIMIGGYAQLYHVEDAINIFNQMCQEGAQPNEITYLSILNACASPGALKWGKDVHTHIRHGGFGSDVRVGTALLKMYAKCGSIKEAREVFDRLGNRDVISWTVMIGAYAESGCGYEAYELFLQMQQEGHKADAFTYSSLLNQRASVGALEWVKDVHSHALKSGLELNVRVATGLINMYAKCGSVVDARKVFNRLVDRNIVSWNVIIRAYAESGCGVEAYQLFLQMQQEGFKADNFTYVGILNPCASVGALAWVKDVHAEARKAGLQMNVHVGTALVNMYAKSGSINDARHVFDEMASRDVTSWNVMIGAYAEHGCGAHAFELFLRMQQEGFAPDKVTFLGILKPYENVRALKWVKMVYAQAVQAGLESDLCVGNAFVHMYAKSGSIDDARLVFDRMPDRDVITWNAMIGGLAQHGFGHEAFALFLQMQRGGFVPNATTYVSILNACASSGALEWVQEVHGHALKVGLESDLHVGNALVHMYAKCGSIDDARLVFDRMVDRDVITWNAMIGGLARHGYGHEALQVYEKMKAQDVEPNERTFVAVISACSHNGLVDEGFRHFLAMTQVYCIKPSVLHYTCMVDLLGRAGHLEEAKLFIHNMPLEPDGAIWGALLGACRTHGNLVLAELAAKEHFKLEPNDASAYVVLSNMYAAAGKWDQVSLVRSMMKERGIHKEPGCTWIEVDKKIHQFVAGDVSHPEVDKIYAELNTLTEKIKAEGYVPDTRLVLHNIDEEDKELALCSHSEKLAIAYGLMHTSHGKPIRVFKNLRVCTDCHTATKFISKVTGREIVARDANRFHHFKDGMCSCGDYW